MLLAIELTLNLFSVAGIILISIVTGYSFRSSQITRLRRSAEKLENEMLERDAEILRLQKELSIQSNPTASAPIVPIREKMDVGQEKLPDSAARKKLLASSFQAKP